MSKIDKQIESGEYFLSKEAKERKAAYDKLQKQKTTSTENQKKRQAAFVAPKEDDKPARSKSSKAKEEDVDAITASLKAKAKAKKEEDKRSKASASSFVMGGEAKSSKRDREDKTEKKSKKSKKPSSNSSGPKTWKCPNCVKRIDVDMRRTTLVDHLNARGKRCAGSGFPLPQRSQDALDYRVAGSFEGGR